MKIYGLQKLTLLDYPGRVACTVFLGGCNFRCPFCHNSELFGADAEPVMEGEELIAFLKGRRGILDGVCVTGGEPTLQPELLQFLREIKVLGYPIKLDTNGYRPEVLRAVVEEGLVDYVAMDVKNSPGQYPATAGAEHLDLKRIEQSIRFLLEGQVDYELRTTVVEPLHDEDSVAAMGRWLAELGNGKKAKRLYLQPFVDRETVPVAGLKAPETAALQAFAGLLQPCAEFVGLRGV